MTRDEMAKGMALLSTAFNRQLTGELVELYLVVLGQRLDAGQWERAVRRALEAESFWPAPAVLLRYGLAEGATAARAVEMYERVLSHYESGEKLGPREVRERYGEAAMEAFVSAGGTRAFAWCEPKDEPFRRRDFIKAWVEVTEQEPDLALPTGADRRLLS